MSRHRRVIVVKQEQGCLTQSVLILLLLLLLIILAPFLFGCVAGCAGLAIFAGSELAQQEAAVRDSAQEVAQAGPKPDQTPTRAATPQAPEDAQESLPPPPDPGVWDGYQVHAGGVAPPSEADARERLSLYQRTLGNLAIKSSYRRTAQSGSTFRGFCDALYPLLVEAEPSLADLPGDIQDRFMRLMYDYVVKSDTIGMVRGLNALAASWVKGG